MIYRMLDSDGDYVFGRGKHAYLEGIDAVTEDGLPLWEQILAAPGSQDSLTAVDLIFKERIEGTTGVLSLLGYESDFDRDNRKYTFKAAVETMYGDLIISNLGVNT